MSKLLTATITDLRSCKNAIKQMKDQNMEPTHLWVPAEVFATIRNEVDANDWTQAYKQTDYTLTIDHVRVVNEALMELTK